MIKDLKRTIRLLTNRERNKLIYLTVAQFFSGVMDLVGVVSIVPFLTVVSNKEILNKNIYVLKIKEIFSLNNEEIIIYFALLSIILLTLNQALKLFCGWYSSYISVNIWSSLVKKSFKFYLTRPYEYHINTNSNQILEKISIRVNAAVAGVIGPSFLIIGYFFTCIFLFSMLFIANPVVTTSLVIFTSLFYLHLCPEPYSPGSEIEMDSDDQ